MRAGISLRTDGVLLTCDYGENCLGTQCTGRPFDSTKEIQVRPYLEPFSGHPQMLG